MSRKNRSPEEKARRGKIRELLQMANIDSMDDIQDLFKETIAEFMENGLEAELDEDLGYSKYDYKNKATDNSRNGHSSKNLRTSFGDVEVTAVLNDIREAHRTDKTTADASGSEQVKQSIEELRGFKGSDAEKKARFFCSTICIDYGKLTREEFANLIAILKKADLNKLRGMKHRKVAHRAYRR